MSGLHDDQHNEYRDKAARKARGDHKKSGAFSCLVMLIIGLALASLSAWAGVMVLT